MYYQRHHSRLRDDGERRVTPMELFFDLVYVFAITQLSHLLLEHLDLHGVGQTTLLLIAVWIAWIYTAWFTNWFDPDNRAVRTVLIGVMVCSLVMSATIPEAFGERGLIFAAAYAAMQVGRTVFALLGFRGRPADYRNFQRIVCWVALSGVVWIAGGLASDANREWIWVAALGIDLLGPIAGFYVPGLGRSTTHDWAISGEHMAERCQLFLIIALGESILVTGATFGELEWSGEVLVAFVVAFLGSVALWWVYFDRAAGDAEEAISRSDDPGRLGRNAYTYLHIPMVAGVIVTAVGDELAIAHPIGHASPEVLVTVLGGPALFLAGHALFKRAVFNVWSFPRLTAIVTLGLVAVIGRDWAPLALASAALIITAGVAWWDIRAGPYGKIEAVGEAAD